MSVAVRLFSVASSLLCTTVWMAGCDGGSAPQPEPAAVVEKKAPAPKPVAPPAPEPEVKAPEPVRPDTPKTFEDAVAAAVDLYSEHRRTLYCGCAYTPSNRIARGTCGYKTRADESLGKRVAWDRIVPTRAFGAHRQCWREPVCKDDSGQPFRGVRCCEASDPAFAAMSNDLHNLVPAVGELQEDRSDFDFEELDGEARMYGACDFEVDRARRAVEPREEIRGDIARAYLYMHETYGEEMPLSATRLAVLEAWHAADPPDEWEVRRNKKIAAIQGRANSFIPMMVMAADTAADAEDAGTPAEAEAASATAAEADAPGATDAPGGAVSAAADMPKPRSNRSAKPKAAAEAAKDLDKGADKDKKDTAAKGPADAPGGAAPKEEAAAKGDAAPKKDQAAEGDGPTAPPAADPAPQ